MPRTMNATTKGFIWIPPFHREDNRRGLKEIYSDTDEKSSRTETLWFCKRTGNKDSKSDLGHVSKNFARFFLCFSVRMIFISRYDGSGEYYIYERMVNGDCLATLLVESRIDELWVIDSHILFENSLSPLAGET